VDGRRSWIALLVAMLLTLSAATACTSPSAPPPAPAPPFVPAPPGTAQFPAQVIDLANWYLTLPTGENNHPALGPAASPVAIWYAPRAPGRHVQARAGWWRA
jgi:hypothetical protein